MEKTTDNYALVYSIYCETCAKDFSTPAVAGLLTHATAAPIATTTM